MKLLVLAAGHIFVYLGLALLLHVDAWHWSAILAVLLVWVSVVDFERLEIPDAASILLVFTGIARLWLDPTQGRTDHLIGGVVWPLLMGGLAVGYHRFRGWNGLGFGDVKLVAGIGFWVGFQATIWVVLAASLAGLLSLAIISVARRQPLADLGTSAIAFGPFLCLSTWVIAMNEGLQS